MILYSIILHFCCILFRCFFMYLITYLFSSVLKKNTIYTAKDIMAPKAMRKSTSITPLRMVKCKFIKYTIPQLKQIAKKYRIVLLKKCIISILKSLLCVFMIAQGNDTQSMEKIVETIIPYRPIIGVRIRFSERFTHAEASGRYLSCFQIPPASLNTIKVRGASSAKRYNAKRNTKLYPSL